MLNGSACNRLLDSILDDCPGLRKSVEALEPSVGAELCGAQDPLKHLYFPTSGVLSVLVEADGGGSVEALTVGNEGFVGISIWLGLTESLEQIVQQGRGEIARIPASRFCSEIAGHRRTERLLKRFTAYSLRFHMQNAVCNRYHNVTQRMCRWLLSAADRSHACDLPFTHTLIARMLGTRRQTVTETATRLQKADIIRHTRSQLRIVKRTEMEALACHCYQDMKDLYERLVACALELPR
jgi:CRP-like cAMP-binding protein